MALPSRDIMLANARNLRREMTPWERKLWYLFLKSYPIKIRRQSVIGPFIADFYCARARLIIELDGSQHFMPEGHMADDERTAALEAHGYSVLRFPNIDVDRNFRAVCETIDREIRRRIEENAL